ncbi:hypothetical protein V5799_013897, partial [Amblyomma americanum]
MLGVHSLHRCQEERGAISIKLRSAPCYKPYSAAPFIQHSQDPAAKQSPGTYQCSAHKLATLFMMTAGGSNAAMFPMMFIFYGGGTGYALTLYVLLRVVADMVPLSDVLVQMAGMMETFPWGGGQCPGGWSVNNRTCYTIRKGSTLCRAVRSMFSYLFERDELVEGVPLLRGDLVVLVPSRVYRHEAANCTPDLHTPAPVYDLEQLHRQHHAAGHQSGYGPGVLESGPPAVADIYDATEVRFRRLSLSSRLMTNGAPSTFVKVCWTSIIPVTVATLMWGKAAFTAWESYPIGLAFIIAWFEMVEFSFIPVFAVVFLVCTKMKLKNSLDPLPTWTPLSWEDAMVYRHHVLVEDIDRLKSKPELEKGSIPPSTAEEAQDTEQRHSHKKRHSPTSKSTSEHFATHQYVPSDPAKCVGSPTDWRECSSEEAHRGKKSKKKRASKKIVPESGTTHVSQRLSSLRRLARRTREAIVKPKKPAAVAIPSAGLAPSAPIIRPPAGGIPEVEYNVKPRPATNAHNDSGETIDNQDFVIDSAAEHFLLAPVASVGSMPLKQPAQQDAASLKSVSSHRDSARKDPTQPRADEMLEPSVQERRPEPYLLSVPYLDAKLAVPHKGASNGAAPAASEVRDQQLVAPEEAVKRASEGSKAQKVSGPAQDPLDIPARPDAFEENAPLKQVPQGPLVTTSFEGQPTASKKSSSRKHSSSKSSSSSQKAPGFATADKKPLQQAVLSGTSLASAAAAPPGDTSTAPYSGKSSGVKGRRQSKLKQPEHNLAQASDASSPDKAFRGERGEDRKLVTKTASKARRSSSQAVLAVASAGKPSNANTSRERPVAPNGAASASGAASRAVRARAPSTGVVTSPDKCEAVAKGQRKTTASEKASGQRGMNVAGMST